MEKKRGLLNSETVLEEDIEEMSEEKKRLLRLGLFWFNVLLILAILCAIKIISMELYSL